MQSHDQLQFDFTPYLKNILQKHQPTVDTPIDDQNLSSDDRRKKELVSNFILKCFLKKKYAQMKRQHRYRSCVLQELYHTEFKYVQDLYLMITLSSILSQWASKQKIDSLFSNAKQIYKFNQDLLKTLHKVLFESDNYLEYTNQKIHYKPYGKIGDKLLEYGPFFKFYLTYYQGYKESTQILEYCRSNYPEFKEYIMNLPKMKEYSGLEIESYLIKPIQRLPKYTLLFTDLIKHTDKDHPDYQNLVKVNELFSKVLQENNSTLNKILENTKLFELQTQFPEFEIANGKRDYKGEELMTIFWKNNERNVLVYILSNALLITERNLTSQDEFHFRLLCVLELDDQSDIEDMEDSDHFKNLIKLATKSATIVFIEPTKEAKKIRIDQFTNMLNLIRENSETRLKAMTQNNFKLEVKYPIRVEILGVDERKNLLSSYRVYITEVWIGEVYQRIFLRFSECQKIQDEVNKQYKCSLNYIKHKNLKLDSDKELEGRTLQLTNFVTALLQQPFMKTETKILKQLGLSEEFYLLPSRVTEKNRLSVVSSRLSERPSSRSVFNTQSQRNFDSEQNTFYKVSASELITQNDLKSKVTQSTNITVHVFGITLNMIEVSVNNNTRALDLLYQVGQLLDLQDISDFRIMVLDNKQRLKPLNEDEIILTLFSTSIFSQFQKKEVYLRKYLFYDIMTEILQFSQDKQKLKLIFHQIVNDILTEQYYFNFDEYCVLSGLYLIVQQQTVTYEMLFNIIPKNILKSEKKEVWLHQIEKQFLKNKSTQNTMASESEFTKQDQSTYMIRFIEIMFGNPLFGKQLFYLTCKQKSKEFGNENVILAIGYDKVCLFDIKKTKTLEEFRNITEIRVLPGSVSIKYEQQYQFETPSLKLETSQGFQIQSLYNDYIKINK